MSWIMDIYKYLRLIRFLLFSTTMYTFVTCFEEVPSSLIVSPGTEATFRCRHRRADIIGWLVNGTSIGQIINSDITPGTIRYDGGILVHTLTIVASPEYDNSKVECVASFVHQQFPPTLSPVVTLTVLEGLNMTSYEGFTRVPSSFNVTEGSGFTFTCQHARTKAIEWCINGILRFDDNFPPNVTATFLSLPSGETVHSLQIHQPAANLNGAIIQCAAFIELQPEKSLPAVVLVQGRLQSVTSISRNTTTISWDEPFSLDLAGVDPDIVYCVEVYDITCGRRDVICDCNVTEPSYTSDDIAPDGYIYEYIITPRSNVEGASNGSNSAVIEQFVCFNESARGWRVSVVNKSLTNVTLNVNVYLKKQDAVKPTAFSAVFNSVDGVQDFDGFTMPVAITPSGNDSSVDIILEVPFRRVLDTTVLAYDCKEHPLTDAIELGTHDIYDISVSSPVPDVVMVTGDVICGSTSRGILAVVYSDFNISYYYVPHNSTQPGVYSVGVKLPDNQYQVSVFVVEESRQPLPRAAARPKSVFIIGSSEVKKESSPIKYELFPISTGVCITCTFLDSSTTDCVAVVHQRISQLSSSGLMNIESSHKFTRSGDTAYGCIEGLNLTAFQVGVIGADLTHRMTADRLYCNGCLIGSSISLLLLLAICYVIIMMIFLYIKRRKHKEDDGYYNNTACATMCDQECGDSKESHSHIAEEQPPFLARSVSDVDMPDLVSSWNTNTIPILKDRDIPIAIESSAHRESDSIFRLVAEEQPLQSFCHCDCEENQQSLCSVSSGDRDVSAHNVDVLVTKCTEDNDEAVIQMDYPVVESESGFEGTSSLTLPLHGSFVHITSSETEVMYSLKRLKPFVSNIRDTHVDDLMEESTDLSSKFEAPQMEMAELVVGDREGFPVQVTDQNSPADSDHITLPNVFFHPRHNSKLSQEELTVDPNSCISEVSGIVKAKPEIGPPLRSPKRSVLRGHPETKSNNKMSNLVFLPHFESHHSTL